MHNPALADLLGRLPALPLRISEAAHSPRPRVVVCGRMPAVAPGRAPRVEVTGYGLCRDR